MSELLFEQISTPLVYGTYRLYGEVLEDSLNQAMLLFQQQYRPLLVDSAEKYNNLDTIIKVMKKYPALELGWKVEYKATRDTYRDKNNETTREMFFESVMKLISVFQINSIPIHRIFRILLHNYHGPGVYQTFQEVVDGVFGTACMPIGVCNISSEQIIYLAKLDSCRINYIQNEYHPFLESKVPQLCIQNDIWFESHSTLTNITEYPKYLNDWIAHQSTSDAAIYAKEYIRLHSPAQIAISYAASALLGKDDDTSSSRWALDPTTPSRKNDGGSRVSVCFTTTNWVHLNEVCSATNLPEELISYLRQLKYITKLVQYRGDDEVNTNWLIACDTNFIQSVIFSKLVEDVDLYRAGKIPSRLCLQIPKRQTRKNGQVFVLLAKLWFNHEIQQVRTLDIFIFIN